MHRKLFFFLIEDITSSFEKTDLVNATEKFDKVILITASNTNHLQDIAKNLSIHQIGFQNYKSSKYVLKAIFNLPLILNEFFSSVKYFSHFNLFKHNVSSLLRALYLADEITKINELYKDFSGQRVFYSFWCNNLAFALALMKNRNVLKEAIYMARAHGTDLFEERVPVTKRIPFRKFQLRNLDRIFSVSKKGADYLKSKYPKYKNRIFTSYLGTIPTNTGNFESSEKFTIISCAKIRNIKRIHLIPEILTNIDFPIRWIHVGGISEGDPTLSLFRKNYEELKKYSNVEVSMVGELNNEDVLKIYTENSVNLFLSVSETEGLPVSMMEAISFGVPVMATNVGGCNEIVNEQTGILIEKDFNTIEVAQKIRQFYLSDKNSETFRKGVFEFWNDNFKSEANFDKFCNLIN